MMLINLIKWFFTEAVEFHAHEGLLFPLDGGTRHALHLYEAGRTFLLESEIDQFIAFLKPYGLILKIVS